MASFAKSCPSTIIRSLRYRDAHKAIDFLVSAFGFERKAVYDNPDGSVGHAELTFGNGMIMLGSASNQNEWSKHLVMPDEVGNRDTSAAYLIVTDPRAVFESAKAAGARIVMDFEAKDYGGSGFSCADPEGHLWSFGDYDPWA